MPRFTFGAVLFDCDGVLADSEPITNGVLRDMHPTMTRSKAILQGCLADSSWSSDASR